eukprot:6866173-Prymnesium_polylepis.1
MVHRIRPETGWKLDLETENGLEFSLFQPKSASRLAASTPEPVEFSQFIRSSAKSQNTASRIARWPAHWGYEFPGDQFSVSTFHGGSARSEN